MPTVSRRTALKAAAAWAIAPALLTPLARSASAADVYADAKFVAGEPPQPEAGSFCLAVLPDTQNYSEKFPEIYQAQTRWIAEAKKDRNIVGVLHLGDVTNHNAPAEWENASKAMATLDGVVPYCMVAGNHDYSAGGACKDRTTLLNKYFPLDRVKTSAFGGTYDKEPEQLENAYYLLDAGERPLLVLALEFGPRADVVRWANEVVAKHKDRAAILITHAYMYSDESRYDWAKNGNKQTWNPHDYAVAKTTADDIHDGEQLWTNLVSKHDNFVATLNGHVLNDGLGRTVTKTAGGNEVAQMLVNFQMKPNGGDGWLRLIEFRSDGKTLQSYDYSPTRNECNASEQNQFSLTLARA